MRSPTPLPRAVDITHHRWKSKSTGVIVSVTQVCSESGAQGNVTFVTFICKKGKTSTWPATPFLQSYRPVGKKLQRKTVWQMILEDPN